MGHSLFLDEEVWSQDSRQSGVKGQDGGSVLTIEALLEMGETWRIHIRCFRCLSVCTE